MRTSQYVRYILWRFFFLLLIPFSPLVDMPRLIVLRCLCFMCAYDERCVSEWLWCACLCNFLYVMGRQPHIDKLLSCGWNQVWISCIIFSIMFILIFPRILFQYIDPNVSQPHTHTHKHTFKWFILITKWLVRALSHSLRSLLQFSVKYAWYLG